MAGEGLKLNTGYHMPTVALGCGGGQSEPGVVKNAVKEAIRAGYRHIDTAQVYRNEAEIGDALIELLEAGEIKREQIFITSKLGMAMMHPSHVREEFERTLRTMKVDYLDLFLLHSSIALSDEGLKDEPRTGKSLFPLYSNGEFKLAFIDPSDSYKEMEKLVEDGLVRSIGVSNFSIPLLNKIIDDCKIVPANIQNECHILYQAEELLLFCKEKGITFSAYSPFGSPGRTSNASPDAPILMEIPEIVDLAKRYKKTPAQILLRFLVQRGLCVVPKSSNAQRIKENIELFNFFLSEEDMKILRSLDRNQMVLDIFKKMRDHHPFAPVY